MPESKRPLKVFLCHAHADRDSVRGLYTRLTKDGVDAWLDKAKLLPGQDWELEIRKAVREADIVVVCLSKQFNQTGFRQKEVRLALDMALSEPEGESFIIPVRLEECDTLESLRKWHWVDLFEEDGYEMLLRALNARAAKIGMVSTKIIDSSETQKSWWSPVLIGFLPTLVKLFRGSPRSLDVEHKSIAIEPKLPKSKDIATPIKSDTNNKPPKVFISYAWEDDVSGWVRDFATRLRADGVNAILDQWIAIPGDQLPQFMEKSVRSSDFVLVICTPKYKRKCNNRSGGVGYEGDVITNEILIKRNHRKFIPILYKGKWKSAAPSWIAGKYYLNLREDNKDAEKDYRILLRALHHRHQTPPPIGDVPDYLN